MANIDKKLLAYYEFLHFNDMDVGNAARFDDWVKQDTLTDNMKKWRDKFLKKDANDNLIFNAVTGHYERETIDNVKSSDSDGVIKQPDQWSDSDLQDLYRYFQKAFISMNASKSDLEKANNHNALAFLNEYFGTNKIFNISPAKDATIESAIADMRKVIFDNKGIKDHILEEAKDSKGEALFTNMDALDSFLKDLNSKKYNTDFKVQTKTRIVASLLARDVSWSSSIDSDSPEYEAINNIKSQLNLLTADDAFCGPINNLDEFKGSLEDLLRRVYSEQGTKEAFAQHDDEKISKQIKKAKEATAWDDKEKEDFIPAKEDDELNFYQKIEKWAADSYENSFKKYEELRGGRLFFKQEAKDIFKAIDSCKDPKIKPSDGLDALLKRKNDVIQKINNPIARKHFEYFTTTMGKLKETMPKALEGCWKNGRQMKAVINGLIANAVKDAANGDTQAVEKAKTAMEIMTAMKYGLLTSKTMDALKEQTKDMTMFSDSQLSWNKNEGIQFVTKAFDKSLRVAFLGVGYTATFIGNKIRLSGSKFNNKDNSKNPAFADEQQRVINENNKLTQNQNRNNQKIANNQQTINNLGTGFQTEADITQREAELNDFESNTLQSIQNRIDRHHSAIDSYNQTMNDNKSKYDAYITAVEQQTGYNTVIPNEIAQKNQQIQAEQNALQQIHTLTAPNGQPYSPEALQAIANTHVNKIQQLEAEKQQLIDERTALANQLPDIYQAITDNLQGYNDYDAAETAKNNEESLLSQEQQNLETAKQNYGYDNKRQKIDDFNNAKKSIEEAQKSNEELEEARANNNNLVVELENYWNFLQSGDTKTWGLNSKRAQKNFDAHKMQMWQQWQSSHGLSA